MNASCKWTLCHWTSPKWLPSSLSCCSLRCIRSIVNETGTPKMAQGTAVWVLYDSASTLVNLHTWYSRYYKSMLRSTCSTQVPVELRMTFVRNDTSIAEIFNPQFTTSGLICHVHVASRSRCPDSLHWQHPCMIWHSWIFRASGSVILRRHFIAMIREQREYLPYLYYTPTVVYHTVVYGWRILSVCTAPSRIPITNSEHLYDSSDLSNTHSWWDDEGYCFRFPPVRLR